MPERYFEQMERPLRHGEAMQLHNETASALEIGTWLAENGIQAWVLPKSGHNSSLGAMIKINNEFRSVVAFPSDWILIVQDIPGNRKYAIVLDEGEFRSKYKSEKEM